MIDEEITYREKGYRSTDLGKWSKKKVWAVCEGEDCQREGGRGRWVRKDAYRDLCTSCAHKGIRMERCETPTEKLPWIDDEITFREKGYRSTELKPGSNKPVWRVCAGCGECMWLAFNKCCSLCIKCAHRTEEFRMKMRELQEGNTHSDKTKKLISDSHKGEKHPNWQGGKSFEPYCEKFDKEFKEAVRDRFDRICFLCNEKEDDDMKLDVHHVNYDKECICNGVECEFVPLHRGCHMMTNYDRELWERLIINVLWYEGYID